MNNLEIFKNEEFGEVRTILKDCEPWFVGKDVAVALGYSKTDKAINQHIDEEDKLKYQIGTSGQNRNMIIINESGLYSLILGSKLPSAKKFKRWITREVIPSIRKNGAYLTDTKIEEILSNPDTIIKLATELKVEREEKRLLQLENYKNTQMINELKPKADYTDKILQNKSIVPITSIAKDYGMSGTAMNNQLHELGVQYNLSGQWLLYAKYQDKGYTHSETIPIYRKDGTTEIKLFTKWTQKGRLFLYNLLKENGLLPVIERKV